MEISPEEYENYVQAWFDGLGYQLANYQSVHRNIIHASDGDYEIDIDITYEVLGVDFRILVECKKFTSNIKREVIQLLHQKIQTIGAHKGIVCSTSSFQNGALKYAKVHGIACIQVVPGEITYHTKAVGVKIDYDVCKVWGIPRICGYLNEYINEKSTRHMIVDEKCLEYVQKYLEK